MSSEEEVRGLKLLLSYYDLVIRLGEKFKIMNEAQANISKPNGVVRFAKAEEEFFDLYEIVKIYGKNNPFEPKKP